MPTSGTGNKATELQSSHEASDFAKASTDKAADPDFPDAWHHGWRRSSRLQGKPDFIFPKLRIAAFVDGCFWPGCPKHGTKPKTNAAFRRRKIARNRKRDREVGQALRQRGWRVLRIWEHELKNANRRRLLARLRRHLSPDP